MMMNLNIKNTGAYKLNPRSNLLCRIAFRNVFRGRRVLIRSYELEMRQTQLAKIVLIEVKMIPMCIHLAQYLRILEKGLKLKRVML